MTLHEPKCGCCGCKSLNILRQGPLRGEGVVTPYAWPPPAPGKSLAAWLNADRDFNDYEPEQSQGNTTLPGWPYDGFGPTKIVSAESTWEHGNRTDSLSFYIGQTYAVGRGSATFDLNASTVSALTSFRPIIARNPGQPFFYPDDEPPEENEINSSIVLSIYGDAEGTYSIDLLSREYPEDFYDTKPIFYDADKDEEPRQSNRINRFSYDPLGWHIWTWNAYVVYPNASAIDTNRGYDGDAQGGYYQNFAEVRAVVKSFRNLPEPESKRSGADGQEHTLLAIEGTKLSEFKEWKLEGIEDFIVYSESMSLCNVYCGWTVAEEVAEDDRDLFGTPTDPREGGYDGKSLLVLGESQRLVNTPGPTHNRVYGGDGGIYSYDTTFSLTAYAEPNEDRFPEEVACTAYIYRGHPNGAQYPASITNSDGTIASPARARVTYYRNGEQVLQAINPTKSQIDAIKAEEGSYLVMTEALPTLGDDGQSLAPSTPRMIKDFSSFVVDKTKPVVAFVPISDVYGKTSDGVPRWGVHAFPSQTPLLATEPVSYFDNAFPAVPLEFQFSKAMDEEDGDSVTARPTYFNIWMPNGAPGDDPPQQGTHTLTHTWLSRYSPPRAWRFVDRSGNDQTFVFQQQWTIHPKLQQHREGVVAKIEDPGFQTREHYRPRLQSEPVQQLRMTFSRKIDPSGISPSQFSLSKSTASGMEAVEDGISIEPVGDGSYEWLITITAEQPERTFFMLTYDAAGDVVTDDIEVLQYPSTVNFPSIGKYKVLYQAPLADGSLGHYSWSPGGYVPISGNYPLDPIGAPYSPEPCVLVSRTGWLMADMDGWHRKIDTSYTPAFSWDSPWCTIGRIASVTETTKVDVGKVESTITAKGGLYLGGDAGTIGTFSPGTTFDGFTPGVPSLESPEADASWWGLSTTIDPSPPALISACGAPKAAQRHASAIRCNGDIKELELTLEPSGGFDYAGYKYQNGGYFWAREDFAVLGNSFNLSDENPFADTAALLVAKEPTTLTFVSTLEEEAMSQNVWSCVQDGSAAALNVAERCERDNGYKCSGDDRTWYAISLHAPTRDVSLDDVKDWDVDPDFTHAQITRNGQQVTPGKYMPGDRYGAGAPPSQAGKAIAWWQDRLNPYDREEYEYVRGSASGIIRKLASGTLRWVKTQGTVSASRSHKEFKALKTTTLGELVLNVSLRVTVKATLNYEDRKNGEQYFGPMNAVNGCFDGTWDNTARAIRPGPVYGEILNNDANAYVTGFRWGATVTARGTWEDAEQEDSRTLTHRFFADLNSTLILTAEHEEKLSKGEELVFPAFGYSRWRLKAKIEDDEE